MANPPPSEGIGDDFFEQIFAMPGYGGGGDHHGVLAGGEGGLPGMMLQLSSGEGRVAGGGGGSGGVSGFPGGMSMFPLGLSLEQGKGGFGGTEEASGSGKRFRDDVAEAGKAAPAKQERDSIPLGSLFPPFGHVSQAFHGHPSPVAVAVMPHPPAPRPRVRARRGQATDPHSIAERLRRERIAERMRALQELVPNSNKTDRAAMLDEIVEYVKFLRLQVKVLSMSRLGGTGAVAQLVADIPLPSVEGDAGEGGSNQQLWEKWSTDGTERQVAKLMEEDIGAAMQLLQSKALCIMPISLAATFYHTHPPESSTTLVKPEPNAPS